MNHEPMPEEPKQLDCEEVRDLLYLFVCEELDPDERCMVADHLALCHECREALAEHRLLKSALPGGFSRRRLQYYSNNN